MSDLSDLIDILDDNANVYLTHSTVGTGSRMGSVDSTIGSSGWVPFTGLFLVICWFIYDFICQLTVCRFVVGYPFETVELGFVVTKMRRYIESNGKFRYGYVKYYFGYTGRDSLPDVLVNSQLDTAIYLRWSLPFCVNIERSGRGKIVIVQRVHFVFVSHLTEHFLRLYYQSVPVVSFGPCCQLVVYYWSH